MNTELLQGFYLGGQLVEPGKGRVLGRAGPAHLPPKAMEVLLCLAAEPGELLTRDALLETVWGNGNGSQGALSHAVSEIRHALGDHSEEPTFVQTLPRRGYRLMVNVEPVAHQSSTVVIGSRPDVLMSEVGLFENLKRRGVIETALAYLLVGWLIIQIADIVFDQLLVPAWVGTFVTVLVIAGFPIAILLSWFLEFRDGRAVPHELSPKDSLRRRFNQTYLSVIGALLIASIFVFIYDSNVGLPEADAPDTTIPSEAISLPPVLENSIAVLPFYNVDGTPSTDIFAKGLVDDVITELSRIPGLLVSSRGDSFTLEPNSASSMVRERLRVALYLEGSVQIDGNTIRIIVQLIDSETGFHVLSRSIDRQLENYFELRDEVTAFTVANVRVALPPETQLLPLSEHEVSDLDAYVAYRYGKELYEQPRSIELLDRVLAYYQQALDIDPEYAAAHAGRCATLVARYWLSNSRDDISAAESACAAALESSPRLYMVHAALGDLYFRTSRDNDARAAYREALAINPQATPAMAGLAEVYKREQRYEEAEQLLREAIMLQPGNWRNINSYGNFLFSMGRYEEAADSYRQVVLFDPENYQARTNLGSALTMAGNFEAGKTVYEESLQLRESDTAYSNLGVLYYYLGDFEYSISANRSAVDLSPEQAVKWLNLADALYHNANVAEATDAFKQAASLAENRIAIDPSDIDTLLTLAWAKQMLGETGEARQYIARAMAIGPNDPFGLYYSALINVQVGTLDAALEQLRIAVDNGYPVKMLAAEPYLHELRGDQEFRRIVSSSN